MQAFLARGRGGGDPLEVRAQAQGQPLHGWGATFAGLAPGAGLYARHQEPRAASAIQPCPSAGTQLGPRGRLALA